MTHKLEGVEIVAFDWDGTIVDSVIPKIRQNMALAGVFGNSLTELEVRQLWAQAGSFDELKRTLCPGVSDGDINAAIAAEYHNPAYAKRRFGFDVLQVLQRLRHAGHTIALATGLTRELLQKDATSLSIPLNAFQYVQTADDTEFHKPDGRFFDPLLAHFGCKANQLLYIGDETKDAQAAETAGARFVGVHTGMATRDNFAELGVGSVDDIRKL